MVTMFNKQTFILNFIYEKNNEYNIILPEKSQTNIKKS